MALELPVIFLYLGIRGILQVWIPRDSITIKKCRVALGIVSLPLISLFCLSELIFYIENYRPGSWALKPLPVPFFLAWVIFLVTDTLYQYYRIVKISESNT